MRISIDRSVCTGHGRCYALAPAVIDADDDGFGVVVGDGVVPPDEEDRARRAAANCPEDAISVTG